MLLLGLAAVPLVIAASFLGLVMGVAGLCVGDDGMGHATHAMRLCVFFCGAVMAPAFLLIPLWIVLAALPEQGTASPASILRPIFHPPTPIPA
jgi:hypothetical protein